MTNDNDYEASDFKKDLVKVCKSDSSADVKKVQRKILLDNKPREYDFSKKEEDSMDEIEAKRLKEILDYKRKKRINTSKIEGTKSHFKNCKAVKTCS